MKKMICLRKAFAIFAVILCSHKAYGEMSFIHKRFVNVSSIIQRLPFTTITSCSMKCFAHGTCSTIGFKADPSMRRNLECILLEKFEKDGVKEGKEFVSLFVLTNEKKNKALIDIFDCDWICTAYDLFPDTDIELKNVNGKETTKCKVNIKSEPVHGGFTEWKEKTPCSTTCGKGQQIMVRSCENPRPQFGGDQCVGETNKTQYCSINGRTSNKCLGPNIALGKPTEQSSTFDDLTSHEAGKANDGKLFPFVSSTKNQTNPFWQIDLEEVVQIILIRVHLLQVAIAEEWYKEFEVLTSVNKVDWKVCQYIGQPLKLTVYANCMRKEPFARYVKIHNNGRALSSLRIREVQIFKD